MGVTKKSVLQRIPVEITKTNFPKKKGGELICENFGVNGTSFASVTKPNRRILTKTSRYRHSRCRAIRCSYSETNDPVALIGKAFSDSCIAFC